MVERSKDWLTQAERDLEQAKHSLEDAIYEWACFCAQQAAEKAIKAVYERLHGDAWGHSVSKLLAGLPRDSKPPEGLIDKAIVLDRYYIQTRYPNGFDVGAPKDYFTKKDAEEGVSHAEEIIRFCRGKIS
ncbi:MAG: HEPN domain-containing protein [Candidatus Omnitrophica bacterium]|nr:HEPN domain-containing protein [Candidatus Omnitrophota bacterium]